MNELDRTQETGVIFRGILLGMKSTPWKKDPTKFNHKLGLQITKDDGYGGELLQVKDLEITADDFPRFQQLVADYKGKLVEVGFIYSIKKFGDLTFLNEYIPTGTKLKIVPNKSVSKMDKEKSSLSKVA